MKKTQSKAKTSAKTKKQKQRKVIIPVSLKSVRSKKKESKIKPAVEIKPTENATIKKMEVENQRLLKELEIEAALERVRSHSMGMQKSIELVEVVHLLDDEIAGLGIKVDNTSILTDFSKPEKGLNNWIAVRGRYYLEKFHIPFNDSQLVSKRSIDARSKGLDYFTEKYNKVEKNRYFRWLYKYSDYKKIPEDRQQFTLNAPGWTRAISVSKNSVLIFQRFWLEEFTEEENSIFKRFGKVFEQSYTRFLDLQKAEAQTREAQIEVALERIRAKALTMQSSNDLLEVSNVLREQMRNLGQPELESCIIHLYDDDDDTIEAWYAYRPSNQPFGEIITGVGKGPKNSSEWSREVFAKYKSTETEYTIESSGEKLAEWYRILEVTAPEVLEYDTNGQLIIPERLYYHFSKFSGGALLMIANKEASVEAWEMLKRSSRVFELAYTRFLDLKKAEAQTREAKIEAALEKVRSSSLAMHRSDELQRVVNTVIERLKELNIELDAANILIFNREDKSIEYWTGSNSIGAIMTGWSVPYADFDYFKNIHAASEAGQELFAATYPFAEKNEMFNHLFTNSGFDELNAERKKFIMQSERATFLVALLKDIGIQIVSYSKESFLPDEIEILKRFARVFNQAYTRFLDLQKAEAQVRESKIEAALERVRSSSMAMHQSSDLHDVIKVVTDQLCGLDLKFDVANFARIDEEGNWDLWLSTPDQSYPAQLYVPYLDHPLFNNVREMQNKNISFYSDVYGFEETNRFFKHFFENTDAKHTPETRKQYVLNRKGLARTTFLLKNIWFNVSNYDGIPFKEDEISIFRRFANAFEQTYIRFLDLQTAEGQAKEARIEAALEKVRSRSLAMHKSEEIQHVVDEVSARLKELGVGLDTANILIFKENAEVVETWTASTPTSSYSTRFLLPVSSITHFSKLIHAIKTGQELITNKYDFDEKNKFFNYLFEQTDYRNIPEERKQFLLNSPCFTVSAAISKNIAIQVNSYSRDAFSDEENNILKRFTKVFEQAYTRFLDLQKAESQARESQVQLALERVRASTMAMHKSEELGDISFELVKQIQSLGVATWHCAFNIYDEDEDGSTEWGSNAYGTYPKYKTPRVGIFRRYYEIGLTGETLHIEVIGEDRCADHYAFLCTLPGVGTQLIKLRDSGVSFPASQIDHVAYFKYGYLLFITYEPMPEAHDVFKRFAKVFEQTYTRFLDLKNAEAQVREAEIQLALERVRASSMAMHQSNDLHEVIKVVADQFIMLHLKFNSVSFLKLDESGNWDLFISTTEQPYPAKISVPYKDIKIINVVNEALKEGKDFYTSSHTKEEKNDFFIHFFSNTSAKNIPEERKQYVLNTNGWASSSVATKYITLNIVNYQGDPFNDETNEILKRFAKVFEQAYTRFLDLLKAEAQTREAKIEAALERVRAASMAMHKSDELHKVINVVAGQIVDLGIIYDAANFIKVNDNGSWEQWIATTDQNYPLQIHLPYFDHPLINGLNKMEKIGSDFMATVLSVEEKNSLVNHFFENTVAKNTPEERKKHLLQRKGFAGSTFSTRSLFLTIYNFDGIPYTNVENEIFKRFANVFEQAYTRFLDLQKAEAQARDAQIEASLERVRSKTMAMHNSQDVGETVANMFAELVHLGVESIRCGILIIEEPMQMQVWTASSNPTGKVGLIIGHLNMMMHPLWRGLYDAWKNQESVFIYELMGQDLINFFEAVNNSPGYPLKYDIESLPPKQVYTDFFFPEGALFAFTQEPIPAKTSKLFKRFAGVFGQTYRRYLDLQKAEAQSREAQIELGLERVRARAMAMRTSEELNALIGTVFTELTRLDLALTRCAIMIYEPATNASRWWMANSEAPEIPMNFLVKYHKHPPNQALFNAWQERSLKFQYILEGTIKIEWDDFLFSETELALLPDFVIAGMRAPERVYLNASFNNFGNLTLATLDPLSNEHFEILLRFAKVFDLTYTRFNDLQKAEAQALEAQIETALERVRSKTMAMHHSEELKEVISVAFEQLKSLNITIDSCIITLFIEGSNDLNNWVASAEQKYPQKVRIPYLKHPLFDKIVLAKNKPGNYFTLQLSKKENQSFYKHILEHSDFGKIINEDRRKLVMNADSNIMSFANFKYTGLRVGNFSNHTYTEEENNTILRFANVFEQTYTRFLDLQKAEAQSREAQIEVSLERVRSKAMAMQKSEDLANAVAIVFEELDKLNLGMLRCGIGILNKEKRSADVWTTTKSDNDTVVQVSGDESMDIHPLLQGAFDAWLNQTDFSYVLKGEDLNDYYKALTGVNFRLPESQSLVSGTEGLQQYYYNAVFSSGGLFAFRETEFPDEAKTVLKRFAEVFNLTYTRFNDLKQVEAQAREALIELSLERVRAKTMAMHNSQDVGDTVATMFDQLVKLGITTNRCGILIFSNTTNTEVWTAKSNPTGEAALIIGHLDVMIHPMLQGLRNAWKNKESFFSYELMDEDIRDYYSAINNYPGYPTRFNLDSLPTKEIHSDFFFPEGCVFAFTSEPIVAEAAIIFKRFASVFGQTYRRYLDLQKAESQARQAQIETAMEKVRARALAMQKPDELVEVAQVLRKEMGLLGVEELETSSIYIHDETSGNTECWYAIKKTEHLRQGVSSPDRSLRENTPPVLDLLVSDHMIMKLQDTWVGRQMLEFFHSDEKQISIPMQGENRKEWIIYCANHSKVLDGFFGENIPDRNYHLIKFSNGYIGAASPGDISAESWELLQRATAVFSLAYTRFSDLQQAEAQTREAIKRASVDRVRAEIASMRTTTDLEKITPLVWNELTTLGVPFIRCGVFIMDEEQQQIHTFLSTPDGKAIAAFNTPFANPGALTEALPYWRRKEIYKTHWDEAQFLEQARNLIQQGAISSQEKYLTEHRPTSLYLHFLPFLQGMLYVGSETSLTEEELQLVQNLANAFSTAYARYEDFNRLEEAKSKIETTLSDLKSTQSQLVQAEKMASLGELTAGIAHEIQNPLNFVNNFASINAELIDEMRQELAIGNSQSAIDLGKDIKENEEKIMHHGKRAESIVKGMLQHSRTSTGAKEPTDINALADEYMRLSYHGLRAKDKSFNAEFIMDLDPTLPLINVIPQDIGRVLLNLFNNAFWACAERSRSAVNERKKGEMENGERRTERADSVSGLPSSLSPFLPQVTLSTKNLGENIEIRIHDNGPGIPSHIIDKIFQPFFTTKPTGQGTGLGLSLAYDIIKAHGGTIVVNTFNGPPGGELKVETATAKDGEGAEFILQIPIT